MISRQARSSLSLPLLLFLSGLFGVVAQAESGGHPTTHECAISVGLMDHLKPLSKVQMHGEEECRASCSSARGHWDHENYSTRCEWAGQMIGDYKVTLLEVNFASCDMDGELQRVSRRDCVRECTDRLKHNSNRAADSIKCSWDGSAISANEIKKSQGLIP